MENDLCPRLNPLTPEQSERRALRGFGIGLGLLMFFFAWRGHQRGLLYPLGAVSLFLGAAFPWALRPLYRIWMPVVRILGVINLWLVCGVLYYLVVTPYSLILRLCGWRALETEFERGADTYWAEKEPRDPVESSRRIF